MLYILLKDITATVNHAYCALCLVPFALCIVYCILCPNKSFYWTSLLALIAVMAVVIDCQYYAMYMIPLTVLPKPNLILAHPLNTTSTVQSKEAIMRVDFCNMHIQLSCTVTR